MSFLDHAKHTLDKGEPVKGDNSANPDTPDKLLKVGISKIPLLTPGDHSDFQVVDMRAADITGMLEAERASYRNKHGISPNVNDAFRGMGDPSANVGTPTDLTSKNQMNI